MSRRSATSGSDREPGDRKRSSGRYRASGSGSGKYRSGKFGGRKRKKDGSNRRRRQGEKGSVELDRAARSFRMGLPIAAKFALFATLLVTSVMVIVGVISYRLTSNELEAELNRRGVLAAKILSDTFDSIFWKMPRPYQEELSDFREMLETAGSEAEKQQIRQRIEEQRDIFTRTWQEHLIPQAADAWDRKFAQMVDEETVIDVRVTKPNGQPYAIARGGKGMKEEGQMEIRSRQIATIEGVEVHEGYWENKKRGVKNRVRYFVAPVKDEGTLQGEATIFLNAKRIDEVGSSVFKRISIATGVGIVVAILLSILVAGFLTRPIRTLVKDMEIVSAGKLDHRTSAHSRDEIGLLANTFNVMTQNLKVAQQAELAQKALEQELSIATEIQTKLLPERIPQIPGFDIFSYYLSAREVGGDYYDYIVVDKTHLGIVVADVSGKGIPGSMVMTMARSLLRLASHRNISPSDTLKKVNRILAKDMRRGMFVTSLYMVLDVKRKVVRVCSAGHNPLVYYNHGKGEIELINPPGIALGFDKGPIFESNIKEQEIQLSPGDRLVSYTDGVVEAMNEASEEFGDEAFHELVKTHAHESSKDFVNHIIEALERHRGRAEQSDDITITTLSIE